jgi:hypothetical protein
MIPLIHDFQDDDLVTLDRRFPESRLDARREVRRVPPLDRVLNAGYLAAPRGVAS